VAATQACENTASLVTVTVADSEQAAQAGRVLADAPEPFGVPVEVVVSP